MNKNFLTKSAEALLFQRNIFAAVAVTLSISTILMSCFLFSKSERIIVVPPTVEQSFWIKGNNVSPEYLEQMGVFLGQLLLTKSTSSVPVQRSTLLRHSSPSFAQLLGQRLFEEEKTLKKQGGSYMFFLSQVDVSVDDLEVHLQGERRYYSRDKMVSSQQEKYILRFESKSGQIKLAGVEQS